MSDDIAEAKRRLPLPVLMDQFGLGAHAKKSARCPFHDDQHNSFSTFQSAVGQWFWKCHAGCGQGDEITLLELLEGLSNGQAIKRYLELAGGNGSASPKQFVAVWTVEQRKEVRPNDSSTATPQTFDWQSCNEAFTEQRVQQLARFRGYSVEFCWWPKEKRLIGLYKGHIAFPVHENGKVVGAHYKPKHGDKWFYTDGVKTLPLVIGELAAGDTVHVFESYWDAFAFMDVSGERDGIIITRGAGNGGLVKDVVPKSAKIYLWPQNDNPGGEWAKKICESVKCDVKRVTIPGPHKDLNDWTRAGATVDDMITAMANAEVMRKADKSWLDALSESVVTSSQLRDLHLTPRRKLLGDWFCEGDLGFIFAFRGVGKTWLALAIAQALSTGGKLGGWKALAPVKVLYVDGEMPPDLMRVRCEGLQASNANLEFLNHEILFDRTGKTLNITSREVQQAITSRCLNSHAKVLILDNLSTLASGMKENEADSWELVNSWLLDLRRRKVAVVIVHHAGRSGQMRGTSKREDNVFWIIALDDQKGNADDKRGARFVSYFTKPSRNTQEEVPAVEWHFVTEANGDVSIAHKQAQTLDVFRSVIESGVSKCDEIADAMKLPKYQISRMAKHAEIAGWLTRPRRGEYGIKEARE